MDFFLGKWIGVALDDAKGKNDGTVQGKTYFSCPENHGIFVRQSQITAIEDAGPAPVVSAPATPAQKPPTGSALPTPIQSSGLPTPSGSAQQRSVKKSGLRPPSYAGKSKFSFPLVLWLSSEEQIRRVFDDNWRIIFVSTHNICFYGEIKKISLNHHKISSSVSLDWDIRGTRNGWMSVAPTLKKCLFAVYQPRIFRLGR